MVIGQFNETFIPVYDGVARVVKAYAETMPKRGHEVYVIAPQYDTGYRGGYPYEMVDFTSVKISKTFPWKIGFEAFDPHFTERMKQIPFDICHVHCPAFAGDIGIHWAHKLDIPVVGTFHTKFYDDILQVTGVKAFAKIGAKAVADFYSKCDEVWAVSDATGETLREYGYKGKMLTMPNGTNRRVLNPARVPEVIEKFKLRTDVPILLFVGQISWKKNLKTIIESCGILKRQGLEFQLVMAGLGPDEEGVRKLAKEQNLEDRFIMTGHINDAEILDALYSVAALFVFPSTYDNAPMVLREAAAQHTAGLAVAGSCTAEIIKHLENGIISNNTSEDVAKGIKEFLDLPEEKRKAIEQNAYDTIPIPWDGPLMDRILGRYQELIDERKRKNSKFN